MRYYEDTLERFAAMLEHLQMRGAQVWLRETVSRRHSLLVSPEICDGSRTTWALPVAAPSGVSISVAGGLQTSGYTLHSAANLIADDDTAAAVEAVGDVTAYGAQTSISRSQDVSAFGSACHKVSYGSSAANEGLLLLKTADAIPKTLAEGEDYCFQWSVLGTGTFVLTIQFANSGGDVGSVVSSDPTTGSLYGWTAVTKATAVPATADRCTLVLYRQENTAASWYAQCLSVSPGDYPHWHPPECCPAVVEFASAPAADARMTGRATGKWLGVCRMDSSSIMWREVKPGTVLPFAFAATEEHPLELG
jgi:hypothetical protein